MKRKILLRKATRIEGNANIHVEIDQDGVQAARFIVQDFRGFEKLSQGKDVESIPHIVSRICGLCCTAHQLASLQAIEDALGIEVPPAVERLRKIAFLGELISSHALSYFFLTLPDTVGASQGVFDLMKDHPEVAKDAFALRKAGLSIVHILGKRQVHPVSFGVGRQLIEVTAEELGEIGRIARGVETKALELIADISRHHMRIVELAFPAGHEVNYMAYDDRAGREAFKVFNRSGDLIHEFTRDAFETNISEMRVDWSFAKLPYLTHLGFPQGIVLVGPLARLNLDKTIFDDPDLYGLPMIEALRDPRRRRLDNHDECRLLEIFLAAKQIRALLQEDLTIKDSPEVDLEQSGKGMGVVEAPRGILVHSYLIKRGVIEQLRMLVATQINNAFINLTLKDQAEKHVQSGRLTGAGEEMVARCVRTFDPCLTCATH